MNRQFPFSGGSRVYIKPTDIPPLRVGDPFRADENDGDRAAYNQFLWKSQDDLLRQSDRQVEENFRMLHGQQWIVYSRLRNKFVNLTDLMNDDERVWRHMPVLQRLLTWFVAMHARMTENTPIVKFRAGPNAIDRERVELYDMLFRYQWSAIDMVEIVDRLIALLIPSGRAYLKSRIDPNKGDPIDTRGLAMLQLLSSQGSPILGPDAQPIQRQVGNVPFALQDGKFTPTMQLVRDDATGDDVPQTIEGLQPHRMAEGGLTVDVLSSLECRGEWGPTPWHEKAYHIQKSLITPLQFWETFGIEAQPDVTADETESSGIFWRVLFGSGHYGASTRNQFGDLPSNQSFVTVYESWHKPSRIRGMERTKESPGGRLLITTGGGLTVRDGVRSGDYRCVSPIRSFDFVKLPGRPTGTTPQEFMNGPIRTRNRLFAQKLGHATLAANPIRVVDRSQGLEQGKVPNTPGAEIVADRSRSDKPPVEYIGVTSMGADVDQAAEMLRNEIDEMGRISGTEGEAPTGRASSKLVQQLRQNSDRPIAGTMRSIAQEFGRLADDWMVLMPVIYDREKLLSLTTERGIMRSVILSPDLFKPGDIHAIADVESMMPEPRQEREGRAMAFWKEAVWGNPQSPEAIQQMLDYARFPRISSAVRPGGPDRDTADMNVGLLLGGIPAVQVPSFPWYDFGIHRWVLEQFMKSPEYLKQPPPIQEQFVAYWEKLNQAQGDAMLRARLMQQGVEGPAAAAKIIQHGKLSQLAGATHARSAAPAPAPPATSDAA